MVCFYGNRFQNVRCTVAVNGAENEAIAASFSFIKADLEGGRGGKVLKNILLDFFSNVVPNFLAAAMLGIAFLFDYFYTCDNPDLAG